MIEGKGKKSMWMGVFGVAFGVMVGIIAADMVKKNFLNKDGEEAAQLWIVSPTGISFEVLLPLSNAPVELRMNNKHSYEVL